MYLLCYPRSWFLLIDGQEMWWVTHLSGQWLAIDTWWGTTSAHSFLITHTNTLNWWIMVCIAPNSPQCDELRQAAIIEMPAKAHGNCAHLALHPSC